MEWKYLFITLLGVLGLFLTGAAVFRPVKLLVKVGVYFVTGVLLLVVLNIFLKIVGLHIAVNPFTALLAGALHLPGLVLLVVLNYLFV